MMMMTTNELTTPDDPSPDDGDAFRNDNAQHGASSTLPACALASSSMRHGNGTSSPSTTAPSTSRL